MFKRNTIRFIVGLIAMLALAGCGSGDSNTNGTLTLNAAVTDLTGGLFRIDATAIYTNPTNTAQGVPITITIAPHTLNAPSPDPFQRTVSTDTTGAARANTSVQQSTEVIYVDVTASTGGLSQSTTLTIPHS